MLAKLAATLRFVDGGVGSANIGLISTSESTSIFPTVRPIPGVDSTGGLPADLRIVLSYFQLYLKTAARLLRSDSDDGRRLFNVVSDSLSSC